MGKIQKKLNSSHINFILNGKFSPAIVWKIQQQKKPVEWYSCRKRRGVEKKNVKPDQITKAII